MNFNEYQEFTKTTYIRPQRDDSDSWDKLAYPILGINDEAGEVAGKLKKIDRDKNRLVSWEDAAAIASELGDVLYYIAATATVLGYSLEQIAQINQNKLQDRKERGVLGGSGDNR